MTYALFTISSQAQAAMPRNQCGSLSPVAEVEGIIVKAMFDGCVLRYANGQRLLALSTQLRNTARTVITQAKRHIEGNNHGT